MAEQPKNDWKERELGALWTRESKSDQSKFWSGTITVNGEEIPIIVYKNKDKGDNDKAPSLRIYKDRPLNKDKKPVAKAPVNDDDDDLPL